jgi:hypothetical protein
VKKEIPTAYCFDNGTQLSRSNLHLVSQIPKASIYGSLKCRILSAGGGTVTPSVQPFVGSISKIFSSLHQKMLEI